MLRTLTSIKDEIVTYKGQKVKCRTSKGRNKMEVTHGVVVNVYPKIFTMYVESKSSTVSYSYAEILTREVELEVVPSI
ncbi:MAG: Veg family protein [Synergistaceae bacterium]|nr:Veg family protein [Synergistaceae bacterium]